MDINLLRRFLLKFSGKAVKKPVKQESRRLWSAACLLLIVTVAGLIMFGVSGLPWRFFTIFNSMKPKGNINKVVEEYNATDINKISVLTAHSVIRIGEGSSDKIVISYEEPD